MAEVASGVAAASTTSTATEARARAIFNEADQDGSGWLSKSEIKRLMHAVRSLTTPTGAPAQHTWTHAHGYTTAGHNRLFINEDVKQAILGDLHYRDLWRELHTNHDNQIELDELISYMKAQQAKHRNNATHSAAGSDSPSREVHPSATADKVAVSRAGKQGVTWEEPQPGLGLHPHMDELPNRKHGLEFSKTGLGLHPHPDEAAPISAHASGKHQGSNGSRVYAALQGDPVVLMDESRFTSGQDTTPNGRSLAATKIMHLPAFGQKATSHPQERHEAPHVRGNDETPPRDVSPSAAEQQQKTSRKMRYVDALTTRVSESVRAGTATDEAAKFCEDVEATWALGDPTGDDITATFTTNTSISSNNASSSSYRRVTFGQSPSRSLTQGHSANRNEEGRGGGRGRCGWVRRSWLPGKCYVVTQSHTGSGGHRVKLHYMDLDAFNANANDAAHPTPSTDTNDRHYDSNNVNAAASRRNRSHPPSAGAPGTRARVMGTDHDLYGNKGRRAERKQREPRTFMSRVVGVFAALLVLGTHFGIIAFSALFGAATGTIDRGSPTLSRKEADELDKQRARTSPRALLVSGTGQVMDGVRVIFTMVLSILQAYLLPAGLVSRAKRTTTTSMNMANQLLVFARDCLCFSVSLFIGTLLLIGAAATALLIRVMGRRP